MGEGSGQVGEVEGISRDQWWVGGVGCEIELKLGLARAQWCVSVEDGMSCVQEEKKTRSAGVRVGVSGVVVCVCVWWW